MWFKKEIPEWFKVFWEIWNWLKIDKLDFKDFKLLKESYVKLLFWLSENQKEKHYWKEAIKQHFDYTINKMHSVFNVGENNSEIFVYKDIKNNLPLILKKYYTKLTKIDKIWATLKWLFYFKWKTIQELLKYEKENDKWIYLFNYLNRAIIYPIASIFLYNQVLSYLLELSNKFEIEKFELDWKKISIKIMLEKLMKELFIHSTLLENIFPIRYNNFSKYNVFLKQFYEDNKIKYLKWEIKINKLDDWFIDVDLSWIEYVKYHSYNKILKEIIKTFILNWLFSREKNNKLNIKKRNRKENSKVYQKNNFRVKNQTKEILNFTLSKIKNKEDKKFIENFEWYEIDETSNEIENLNLFFSNYHKILKYVEEKYLIKYWIKLEEIVKNTMIKIRKIWHYKASWLYFPDEYVLVLAVDSWKSLVHETWHFIHFKIAEYFWLNEQWLKTENYFKIIWIFNNIYKTDFLNNYKHLKLFLTIINELPSLFKIKQHKNESIEIKLNLSKIIKIANESEINQDIFEKEIEILLETYLQYSLSNKWKYKFWSYWSSSAEIFARLFDRLIWDNLEKIVWWKISENIKLNNDMKERDNLLYQIDNKTMWITKKVINDDKSVLKDFDNFLKDKWLIIY